MSKQKALPPDHGTQPQRDVTSAQEHEMIPGAGPTADFQHTLNLPPSIARPTDLLALQRTLGNRAVGRMLQQQSQPNTQSTRSRPILIQRAIGENANTGAVVMDKDGNLGEITMSGEWRGMTMYHVKFPGEAEARLVLPDEANYSLVSGYDYAFRFSTTLFLVDGNLTAPPNEELATVNPSACSVVASQRDGTTSLAIITYSIHGFSPVYVYWPFAWLFEHGPPKYNKYGWLPQAEFGTPVKNGNPTKGGGSVRAPFAYKNMEDAVKTPRTTYDPAAVYPTSISQLRQLFPKVT